MPARHPVVVIGAGLAGLAAAYELRRAGRDVVILEAQSFPGGRVRTLRESFTDGMYAEAGAIFIPDHHAWTLRYIREFDLPLCRLPSAENQRTIYHIAGQRLHLQDEPGVRWPLELTAEEQSLGPRGILERYLQPAFAALGDPTRPGWSPEPFRDLDALGFAEWLQRCGASPAAVSLVRLGYLDLWGDGVETASALAMLHALALEQGCHHHSVIPGGNDRLPKAFAERLGDAIHYEAPVLGIHQQSRTVEVHFEEAGRQRTLTADRVIVAIPFSTLREVEVLPAFSSAKTRAVAELPYTSISRVFLQVRSRFWAPEDVAVTVASDRPHIMRCLDLATGPSGRQRLVFTYVGGPKARALAELPEKARIAATVAELEAVFPGIGREVERGCSFSWDEQRWIRGAYVWFRPGQMVTHWHTLATPEGRLHFAGEHTSIWSGWMQGALESGCRAAREVLESE